MWDQFLRRFVLHVQVAVLPKNHLVRRPKLGKQLDAKKWELKWEYQSQENHQLMTLKCYNIHTEKYKKHFEQLEKQILASALQGR